MERSFVKSAFGSGQDGGRGDNGRLAWNAGGNGPTTAYLFLFGVFLPEGQPLQDAVCAVTKGFFAGLSAVA